jgi:hypothetical protein
MRFWYAIEAVLACYARTSCPLARASSARGARGGGSGQRHSDLEPGRRPGREGIASWAAGSTARLNDGKRSRLCEVAELER